MTYEATRDRVETYFDRTATRAWAQLTGTGPVSRIRETVRAGRDRMRATLLARLPADLSGARVLDAGCGTGLMTAELAARGAEVFAVDISPALLDIASSRLDPRLARRVTFAAGDMLSDAHGRFDHVVAMDSLIYYDTTDVRDALARLGARTTGSVLFTVAPRTPALMMMWSAGKLFPRRDRSPVMVPQSPERLAAATADLGRMADLGRVHSGFYISQALEFTA
jgi:magnesium-protoporphyrin O-methyltransferase